MSTIPQLRALVGDATNQKTSQEMSEIYIKLAELDVFYFMHYPNFRLAVIQCLRRNYWCKDNYFQDACSQLANHLLSVYEASDSANIFRDHPQDTELYNYLLNLDEDLMSIYSIYLSETSTDFSEEISDEDSTIDGQVLENANDDVPNTENTLQNTLNDQQ